MKKRGVTYLKDEKIKKYDRACFIDGFLIGVTVVVVIAAIVYYSLLT